MLWSEIDTIVSDLTNANTTAFPTATRLIYANAAQSDIAGLIIGTDGRWKWDDTNYTTLPIGTTDLVSGQTDYSFDDDFLKAKKVQILDPSGNTARLTSKDMKDYTTSYQDNQQSNAQPMFYDKDGRSIFLDPTPNYNATDGLKVYFQRTTKDITSFGTTSPGFVATKQIILAYMISLPYVTKHHQDRVNSYTNTIAVMRKEIEDFYTQRSGDEKFGSVTPARENNR